METKELNRNKYIRRTNVRNRKHNKPSSSKDKSRTRNHKDKGARYGPGRRKQPKVPRYVTTDGHRAQFLQNHDAYDFYRQYFVHTGFSNQERLTYLKGMLSMIKINFSDPHIKPLEFTTFISLLENLPYGHGFARDYDPTIRDGRPLHVFASYKPGKLRIPLDINEKVFNSAKHFLVSCLKAMWKHKYPTNYESLIKIKYGMICKGYTGMQLFTVAADLLLSWVSICDSNYRFPSKEEAMKYSSLIGTPRFNYTDTTMYHLNEELGLEAANTKLANQQMAPHLYDSSKMVLFYNNSIRWYKLAGKPSLLVQTDDKQYYQLSKLKRFSDYICIKYTSCNNDEFREILKDCRNAHYISRNDITYVTHSTVSQIRLEKQDYVKLGMLYAASMFNKNLNSLSDNVEPKVVVDENNNNNNEPSVSEEDDEDLLFEPELKVAFIEATHCNKLLNRNWKVAMKVPSSNSAIYDNAQHKISVHLFRYGPNVMEHFMESIEDLSSWKIVIAVRNDSPFLKDYDPKTQLLTLSNGSKCKCLMVSGFDFNAAKYPFVIQKRITFDNLFISNEPTRKDIKLNQKAAQVIDRFKTQYKYMSDNDKQIYNNKLKAKYSADYAKAKAKRKGNDTKE